MLLCASEKLRNLGGIGPAQGVVKIHQPTAMLHKPLQRSFIGLAQKAGVSLVDHHDISLVKVSTAWRMQRSVNHRAVFCEKLAPVRKELRIIVLARKMRLQACP